MYLVWLLAAFWESTFAEKRETDKLFMHRAWESGRLSDAEYRCKGGYAGRRYVEEKQAGQKPVARAPAAFGFRSRPFC